jgi:hypothetical protein
VINRDKILAFIAEEKDKFSSYSQLCVFYKVNLDPYVVARHNAKIEIMEKFLKLL